MEESTPNSLSRLYRQAIEFALAARWEESVKVNREIIKSEPENIDALNRLARSYMELGKFALAKKFYNLVLKYDPYNPIAAKNLKMIKSFRSNGQIHTNGYNGIPSNLSASLFLQEPGKTKIVTLLKVAEPQKLSQLCCGMLVEMALKNRKITVIDQNGIYLGVLPDDVSHNLVRFIKGGNKYEAYIKSVKVNGLSILVRETFRSKRFKNQPSFLDYHAPLPSKDIITSLDTEDADEEESLEAEELES